MTTENKFDCIFCKDVFQSKEDLQIHFRKHADPEFKSKSNFGNESLSKENDAKKTEMVSCDVCSRKFTTISKAISHKHKMHPDHDVKYFCPWCGKLFTMKHTYNTHLQNNHDKEEQSEERTFHCDCCDVDFFLTSAMMYHNKFFHRQDTDIPDIGSSKKLRLYDNQDIIQIYYCAFCGEEYENKLNLYKHVTDDHSDENQSPDEVLRCPLCEAIFYHLDAYEIHLSFHTTEDLYSDNNEMVAVSDFSLETVPPMVEKVERDEFVTEALSQDTDAESSINAVGIENFLELAMASEDSNPGKTKKKKHKKSKKSAITLDEFLSMNQDVFGEGLDFQGVEEVPTRVVAKQFKNNKKSLNPATAAELEKLKSKGIVVMKVGASKPIKTTSKKVINKPPLNTELKTSSELLTKLINQSNKQIKVVKKLVSNNDLESKFKDEVNESSTVTKNSCTENSVDNEIPKSEIIEQNNTDDLNSNNTKSDDSVTSTANSTNINSNKCGALKLDKDDSDINMTSTDTAYVIHEPKENDTDKMSINKDIDNAESLITNDDTRENHSNHGESNSQITKALKTEEKNDSTISERDESVSTQSSSNKNNTQSSINPLVNSLKNLSHITVKHVNNNKVIPLPFPTNAVLKLKEEKSQVDTTIKQPTFVTDPVNNEISFANPNTLEKDPTIDALKILSKNITVRSVTSTKKSSNNSGSDDDKETDFVIENKVNAKLKDVSGNKDLIIKKTKTENHEPSATENGDNSLNIPTKLSQVLKESVSEVKLNNDDNNQEIDKHIKNLPNVISKTPTNMKNLQPQLMKQTNIAVKNIETNHKEVEVIEISDIDDSDEEGYINVKQTDAKQNTGNPLKNLSKHITVKPVKQSNFNNKNIKVEEPDSNDDEDGDDPDAFNYDDVESTSINPLKNLSKHITVKSLNQSSSKKNIKLEEPNITGDNDDRGSFNFDGDIPNNMKKCGQQFSTKNMAVKNVLKNLGKNITIKSRNSSPSSSVKSHDHITQDADLNDQEYESDTETGKVEITEIDGHNSSHDENFDSSDNYNEGANDNEPIIESPHDSCNEEEMDHTETAEKAVNFESEIKSSTVQRTNQQVTTDRNTMCLNNLKNISKSITIKSLSSKQDKPSQLEEEEIEKNQTKTTTPVRLSKQSTNEIFNDSTPANKNVKTLSRVVDQASNDTLNQKISVNKEVTVKTLQTKTIIQEITTTVTKTIKTVNQTVKQETRNFNPVNVPVLPQKVIGMKPSTSKNLQGVVIRHAAPITAKPSTTLPQIRPSGNVVKSSKQIVPMRPGVITRPSTPRMPSIKPTLPKSSPDKQAIGRPLRFSASAIKSSIGKRPNTEDLSGPFSCFKKPKESLIPGTDIPTYSGEGSLQMNASSHTSTSNYLSTSKTIKGNSVVNATQMKSEVTSMQQITRLNNTAGVKVTNAQVKQTHLQEKNESSAMKRTTLEAIEKLQKQGLLIKKPRIEENENSDSEHVGDDNTEYNSNEE